MDKATSTPWEPALKSYPLLILDDHAGEWAARVLDDDPERVELDGEETEAATRPSEVSSPQASQTYAAERVWSGDVSSGLC